MKTLEALLAEHPLFHDLDADMLATLAACASEVHFPAGHVIFREGEDAHRFYVIREGTVALEAFHLELGSIALQTLEPGDVLGWSWLVPPYKWHFDARCLTDVRAFVLDGAVLRSKCMEEPRLGYELLQRFAMLLEQRLQTTRRQLFEAQSRAV